MKNLTLALISMMVSLLLVKYYPYVSKEVLLEYLMAACLSTSAGKLITSNVTNT